MKAIDLVNHVIDIGDELFMHQRRAVKSYSRNPRRSQHIALYDIVCLPVGQNARVTAAPDRNRGTRSISRFAKRRLEREIFQNSTIASSAAVEMQYPHGVGSSRTTSPATANVLLSADIWRTQSMSIPGLPASVVPRLSGCVVPCWLAPSSIRRYARLKFCRQQRTLSPCGGMRHRSTSGRRDIFMPRRHHVLARHAALCRKLAHQRAAPSCRSVNISVHAFQVAIISYKRDNQTIDLR